MAWLSCSSSWRRGQCLTCFAHILVGQGHLARPQKQAGSLFPLTRLLVDRQVCVTLPNHETEFDTYYGHLGWIKFDPPDSHGCTVSAFTELGLEPVIYPDLRRHSCSLRILCRSSADGEII